jgi:endonuclease YncB( thermonuclease family)
MTLVSSVPNFSFAGREFLGVRVCKIYDGDSITLVAPVGQGGELRKVKCRLSGVDACEIRGADSEHGRRARLALVEALRCPIDAEDRYGEAFFDAVVFRVDVACGAFDKYGRVLVEVAPEGGDSVNASLCEESDYFRAYDGKGARPMH